MLAALVFTSSVAKADEAAPHPFELIRTLQNVQDEIVQGSRSAHRVQSQLLRHTSSRFEQFDEAVWSERKNARAAVIFTLSGGNPKVSQKILSAGTIHEAYTDLMKAAIAVAQRNREVALKHLETLNPLKLTGHLGGLVALVNGVLLAKKKPEKASRLFSVSRTLAPGTLIEEAALRRNLIATSDLKRLDRFLGTSSTYIRRFENSIFHISFDKLLASQVLTFGDDLLNTNIEHLDKLLSKLAENRRRDLYVALAKGAVNRAMLKVTKFASARALLISRAGTESFERALLYKAGAEIVSEDMSDAKDALSKLDVKLLHADDKLLLSKIKRLGEQLSHWPPMADRPGNLKARFLSSSDTEAPLFARAEAVFTSVDAILEQVEQ